METRVSLERLGAGSLALLVAAPAGRELTRFRLHTLADVLERVLARRGVQPRRLATAGAEEPDLVLAAGEDEPLPAARLGRLVAGRVLVEEAAAGGQLAEPSMAEFEARGVPRAALRYFTLTAPCGAAWNFSWTGLEGARVAQAALVAAAGRLAPPAQGRRSATAAEFERAFFAALEDGLDTATALAIVWRTVRAALPAAERCALLLDFDTVLQLELAAAARPPAEQLPPEARPLIERRAVARRERDWALADELRRQLAALGVETSDTPQGSVYRLRGAGR